MAAMWLDALVLLLLGCFIGIGALRGGLASALGLLTLVTAYGAAVLLAPRLGPGLGRELGWPALVGIAVVGTVAFAVATVAMGILSRVVRRMHRPFGSAPHSPRDRFAGGVFGGLRGALVVLMLSWSAIWLDALRVTGVVESLPALDGSRAAALTESVVEAGVRASMGDAGSTGRLVASLAARPGPSVVGLQRLVDSPRLEALRGDRMFWTHVEHGSVDAAMNQASFLRLAQDAALRADLAELGLVDEAAARDPGAFRAAAGEVLREVGPRIRGLREDPQLQDLMRDPQVVAMVQQGDTWGLMRHAGFRDLVTRVATR